MYFVVFSLTWSSRSHNEPESIASSVPLIDNQHATCSFSKPAIRGPSVHFINCDIKGRVFVGYISDIHNLP